jgi:hypothetical protein
MIDHYKWLEKHLPAFFAKLNLDWELNAGIIGAHGDKCYSYKPDFEEAGIEFPHGVAIYLITYLRPYSAEVRETDHGWVDTCQWIIDNKDRFLPLLPEIDETDKDVLSRW